jgi:hypothetical protein
MTTDDPTTRRVPLDAAERSALRRKAQAAGQGTWGTKHQGDYECVTFADPDHGSFAWVLGGNRENIAVHIAACDPPTVLALLDQIEHLTDLIRRALPIVEESAQYSESYGNYLSGTDPRCFTPDPECSTDDERAAHDAACQAWARGEQTPIDAGCQEVEVNGKIGFISVQPFGLGTTCLLSDAWPLVKAMRAVLTPGEQMTLPIDAPGDTEDQP